MSQMQDRYDSAFLGILQNEGEISKFLDCLFSFLYRMTDFYVILNSPTDRMGFPPGVAKKLLLSAFERYMTIASNAQKKKQAAMEKLSHSKPTDKEEDETPKVARVEEVTMEPSVSASVSTVTVPTDGSSSKCDSQTSPLSSDCDAVSTSETSKAPESQTMATATGDTTVTSSEASDGKIQDSDENKNIKTDKGAAVSSTNPDDGDDDPEQTRLQKIFQANPESYNGAIRDKYSWSQSITDIDVRVKVPKQIRKGKDVTVDIGKKHLKVAYRDASGQMIIAVDGDLIKECHKEECVWSLVPGEHVHVNLEKAEERWWDALLTDEPKISTSKIDPTRPWSDLDDEATAKVDEMMYNEERKRLGLPQTHETKVHEMLAKAWNEEGSPFKGQPFDPSKINVSPSSGM